MSRRSFLAASGGLVIATSVAGRALAGGNREISALVLSSDLYATPAPQRFAFAVAVGPRYSSGPRAKLGFSPPDAEAPAVANLPARVHKAGLPKGRGVYVADAVFDQPGVWTATLETRGESVPFAVQVKPAPDAPAIGSAASRAASPTRADRLGVKPICTRRPTCPLHSVSLADVVGTGTKVAVMFATPALCASQYCGPVLDELLAVRAPYESAMTFVHVEIYESNRGATPSPTVAAWNLPSEPWLYTVDGAGTIVGRLDGAFGRDEIVEQLDVLAAR
jgi:hypothetical protein